MKGFWYLASPYSKYPQGIDVAFMMVAKQAGLLARAGVPVYSPICHTHPIALFGSLNPLDHSLWMPFDKPMMDAAVGLIMLRAVSWEESYGMKIEHDTFVAAGKPVIWMDPDVVPSQFLDPLGR